jgi:carbonic anhydrase
MFLNMFVVVSCGSTAHEAAELKYSPEEALERLKNGNIRYVSAGPKHPRADAARRSETSAGQHPIATIIGCSDSRSSVEILFDQGIGDVFVVRTAGNVCSINEIASAEYAIGHLNTPVCVVLGHTMCGAVTAAVTDAKLEGQLPALIHNIEPAVARAKSEHPDLQGNSLIPAAIEANVFLGMENLLTRSQEIKTLVSESKLILVGGIYDLSSGEVKWLGSHPRQKHLLGESTADKPAVSASKDP